MKNTLAYRMLIVNVLVAMWVAGTNFYSGWLTKIFMTDLSQMSYLIAGLFVLLLSLVFYQTHAMNRAVSESGTTPKQGDLHFERISPIMQGAGGLFVLGLVGTLIGLGLSVDKVTTDNLSTANGIKEVAAQLVGGIKTEIGVTVLGSLAGLWIELNYAFLRSTAAWLKHEETKQ